LVCLIRITSQALLISQELLPGNVSRIHLLKTNRPILQGSRMDLGLAVGRRAVKRIVFLLAVDVRSRVERIVQDTDDVAEFGVLPFHFTMAWSAPNLGGEFQLLLEQLHQHLTRDFTLLEQTKNVVKPSL